MRGWRWLPICVVLWSLGWGSSLLAADMKLRVQLIWGTDYDKPADSRKIKDLDSKLQEKIKNVKLFRWKNYFEVDREVLTVKNRESKLTSMSHKCVIELKHLGDTNLEVRLYGEGKLVQTVRQQLPPGEILLLAGDDKEKFNDGWIVAVSQEKVQ